LLAKRSRESYIETNIPFGPVRKRQVVAVKMDKNGGDTVRVVVKGAPEYVLAKCDQYITWEGDEEDMTESMRN
jgi:magnesium-transporting ATPase (P-type)